MKNWHISIWFPFFFLFQQCWSPILITESINTIFCLISKIVSVIVLLQWALLVLNKKISAKPVLYTGLIYLCLFISTIIMDGDIRRLFSFTYCPIGLAALFGIYSTNINKQKLFIHSVAVFFYIINLINCLLVIISPDGLIVNGNNTYFLGGENHVGFSLMIGLCFVLCDKYLNSTNIIFLLSYITIQVTAILIIFSGGNVTGTLVAIALLFPFFKQLGHISYSLVVGLFIGTFFTLIVFEQLAVILNNQTIQYIIITLLGKSLTLSGRTDIWDIVLFRFWGSPIIGHGIRESVNLFSIWGRDFSAHNQLLQSLYEGGFLIYISLIPIVRCAGKSLKKSRSLNIIFIATTIGVLLMSMSEAAGINWIVTFFQLATIISKPTPHSS